MIFCICSVKEEFVVTHDNVHLNGLSNMAHHLQKDPEETILYRASSKLVALFLYRALPLTNNIIIQ